MTARARLPRYAPRGLETDPAVLGLTRSQLSTEMGTAVAHSRRTNRSSRATIFLHGAAGSWTTWTPLLEVARERGVSIENPVLLDLPGWGEGTLTPRGETAGIETVCTLVQHCAEDLGFTEWDVVGHSMGGFIAMDMAARFPHSVLSVGTISASGRSIIASLEHPLRHFFDVPAFTLLWQGMRILAALGPVGTALVRLVGRLGLLRRAVSPLFRHPSAVPDSVVEALGREVRPRSFRLAATIARHYDADERWAAIECPVRASQGNADAFSRVSDLDRLGGILPESVRVIIPDCGHFAAIERPDAVLVALGYLIEQ